MPQIGHLPGWLYAMFMCSGIGQEYSVGQTYSSDPETVAADGIGDAPDTAVAACSALGGGDDAAFGLSIFWIASRS